jgi:hypothetical protein
MGRLHDTLKASGYSGHGRPSPPQPGGALHV